ncbi:MAG TPA: sigma-70 family RNA polymerase sigma factor [Blastocatellia bacterium]|nr:sigma-70 family RNA polymerase sigma factor [Blastocatellia bacterium]
MNIETSDKALVLACRRGDEAAWEALIKRYQRLVYSIPRRAGLDEPSASDVFQNVFAILIKKLDRIEQPERIQAWLVTTTRRETRRAIVSQKDSRLASFDNEDGEAEAFEMADQAPLQEEVLLRLESQHQIRMAVESLDERCRKMIALLFYRADPPPYSEIAQALGVPEGSVGPTRARCLQKLMRLLERVKL